MNRKGKVFFKDVYAGDIEENEDGYFFQYAEEYLKNPNSRNIAIAFPLRNEIFKSDVLFPFFDGIIPEGWLLDIVEENWKINPRDRMGLLLAFCENTIGSVSVIPEEE